MFALLLILGTVFGGAAYLATYKLSYKRRLVVTGVTFALTVVFPVGFALLFDDLVSCWLYYDQCTAKRISGHKYAKRCLPAFLVTGWAAYGVHFSVPWQ